ASPLRPPPRAPPLPYTPLFRSRPPQRPATPPGACACGASPAYPTPRARGPTGSSPTSTAASCATRSSPTRHAVPTRTSCTDTARSEEHTSELQSREKLVCRLLL